jgi:uncharacterized protein (DUF1501 family)
VATLIDDLEERGLRDKVLLDCGGEMGRTPALNKAGGRDHWANLAPLMIYGGGLGAGQVIDQTTRDGGNPASNPVGIPDLIATVLGTLVDPERVRVMGSIPRSLLDVLGRGKPILG